MGGIGDEAAQPLFGRLLLVQYQVQRPRQVRGLAPRKSDRDAAGAVTGEDGLGDAGNLADGAQRAAQYPPGRGDHRRQHGQAPDQQGWRELRTEVVVEVDVSDAVGEQRGRYRKDG